VKAAASGIDTYMKNKVLDELQFSVGIVLGGEEVVPRFRVVCPDEEWTIFVPLPDDIGERQRRMQLVYGFMAWKSAVAFVMSSELQVPDVVISAGVGRHGVVAAARPVLRKPLTVGPVEWLPESAVGEEVVALLPRGRGTLDAATEAELVRVFGTGGEFEVRRG
jgi:hypothetical protein